MNADVLFVADMLQREEKKKYNLTSLHTPRPTFISQLRLTKHFLFCWAL